jgi:hypothetical protein
LSLTLVSAVLVAACSGAAPTPPATPAPTPVVTPDPHLNDPASAQDVFDGLGRAGLAITTNTAAVGGKDSGIVTRINATYLGWPLDVTEYRTSDALAKAVAWKPDATPGRGDPPIAIAGANILVLWGPRTTGAKPGTLDARQQAGLRQLVRVLELLLSPLRSKATVSVPLTVRTPAASAAPSGAPSTKPKATPAP